MKPYRGFVIAAGVLVGSMQTTAGEAVAIVVRPAVTTTKNGARLTVFVARDERNRTLVWELDGPTHFRSSSRDLEGASAPRSYLVVMRDLPAGEFELRAKLTRRDGTTAIAASTLKVVGLAE